MTEYSCSVALNVEKHVFVFAECWMSGLPNYFIHVFLLFGLGLCTSPSASP
jgi:hypothetical protein